MSAAKRRTNNTGSIYKDSNGYYVAQVKVGYYPNGKVRYKRLKAKKQSEVVQKLKEFQVLQEKNGQTVNCTKSKTLVKDYGKYYIDTYKTTILKPTSLATDYRTLKNYISPYLGMYTLDQVTPHTIQTVFIKGLMDRGYSYSSVHKAFTLCKEIFNKAEEEGILIVNPCKHLNSPKRNAFTEDNSIEFLDDEEIERFKAEAIKPKYLNGIALLSIIYTGMRAGELCALRYRDIDYANNKIFLKGNVVVYTQVSADHNSPQQVTLLQTTNKRDEGRTIFISDSCVKLFRDLQQANQATDDDFVVRSMSTHRKTQNTEGHDYYTNNSGNLGKTVEAIFKNANIDKSGCHCLRHTYASLLIRKGVDIKIVSKQLGHKSVAFTYDRYVHLIDEQQKEAIKVLNQI